MSERDNGGPAFPSSNTPETGYYAEGMDLRDYFAIKAMQMHGAALANMDVETPEEWDKFVAARAYMTADAMLAERNKQ